MIKQGIKNYFSCLKYFFTPLGTMFLGLLLGFSAFVPGVALACNSLIDGIKVLASNVNLDFSILWNDFFTAAKTLDWNDPVQALRTMISGDWLDKVLTESLTQILGSDFDMFAKKIKALIDSFVSQIGACVFIFACMFVLGFIAGFMLTRLFIRRRIAKRSFWKWILTSVVNAVLTTALAVLCVLLFALWKPSAFLSLLLALVLIGIFALTEAYLVYGYKKIRFTQVLNVKNIGKYLLVNTIIFLITLVFTVLAVAVNALMGIFVGLSFLEIAVCVINMNAESFVQNMITLRPNIEQDRLLGHN